MADLTPTKTCRSRASTRAAAFAVFIGISVGAVVAGAAPTSSPMAWVQTGLKCACFEGSELKISDTKRLSDPTCQCPFADRVRKDLASVVADMPMKHDFDKMKIALALEEKFLALSPEYERMFFTDAQRYRWFLENVRCTCSGCKATVYFSNCQLTCAPAIVYKRRARIWLALGFSTDELIDYYLAEYNRSHSHREQISRDWLLPKKQKKRGWMVPAGLILGAIIVLASLLLRVVQRSSTQPSVPTTPNNSPQPTQPATPMSEQERLRVLDELDSLDD